MIKLKFERRWTGFKKISIQSPLYGSPLSSPLLCPQHCFQKPQELLFRHTTCKSWPSLGWDVLSWTKNKARLGARNGWPEAAAAPTLTGSAGSEQALALSSLFPSYLDMVLGSILKSLPDNFLSEQISLLMNPDHSFWSS